MSAFKCGLNRKQKKRSHSIFGKSTLTLTNFSHRLKNHQIGVFFDLLLEMVAVFFLSIKLKPFEQKRKISEKLRKKCILFRDQSTNLFLITFYQIENAQVFL